MGMQTTKRPRSPSTPRTRSGRPSPRDAGASHRGASRMAMQRRVMSCTGPTLLPLTRIRVRVPPVKWTPCPVTVFPRARAVPVESHAAPCGLLRLGARDAPSGPPKRSGMLAPPPCPVTAARRNSEVARLLVRRVRADRSLPPETLLPGARRSHETKCLAVGHADRSVPHCATSFSASEGARPRMRVRSTPTTPSRAVRRSQASAFL